MTRLDTIRAYFAERFFATLTNDPAFPALRYPAELFDASGNFTVPSDLGGFKRIPTIANLEQRIAAAPAGKEHDDLSTFLSLVRRAFNHITGGLDEFPHAEGQAAAAMFAPVVRHPDDQTYFPVRVDSFLNYSDGTLTARYYSTVGQSALSGRLYDLMFENPDVSAAQNLPEAPYYSRLPFVATVGLGAADPGFPATPLSLGSLDLSSADSRLTPGRLQPRLYAEIKRLPGAIVMNQLYQAAAQAPGRFAPLRNNRAQADPLLSQSNAATSQARAAPRQLDIAITGHEAPSVTVGESSVAPSKVPPSSGPVMIVYHGFYPVDDVARRRPTIGATDREFHHLATALLLFPEADRDDVTHRRRRRQAVALQPRGFVFTCTGPDLVRMMPLDHPFLTKLNDQGEVDPNGSHVVLFAVTGSPTGWTYADQPSDANANIIQDSVAKNAPWGGRVLGGLTFIAMGAGIGAVAGPIGALIGAAVALVIYVFISIICFLFGCGSGDNNQFQQSPAFDPQPSGNSFTQSATTDLAPAGVSQSTGGVKPARTFDLQMIPHFYDRNLYGLLGGGNATLQVVDNAADQEMLAWHSFPAGIGYQFDRKVPGAIDISGSSIRNYFDLFTRKFEDVSEAQAAVTYFA